MITQLLQVNLDDTIICSLCMHPTTWCSPVGSLLDTLRVSHQCTSCGGVVCRACCGFDVNGSDPARKVSLPEYGIIRNVLVCDACKAQLSGILVDSVDILTKAGLPIQKDRQARSWFTGTGSVIQRFRKCRDLAYKPLLIKRQPFY